MTLDNTWFTEQHADQGSAFSLQGELIESVQSPFQKIDIYDTTHFGYLMVIDSCTMVSTRENFLYHEMMSHPALFTHGAAKDVVIIGGGDCGTLKEILKHGSVQSVMQIDIDEQVTRLSEKYFSELCESNDDPRATIDFDDGIAWMKSAPNESVDVLIIDSTDPIGPAEGLFTPAFVIDCYRVLRGGGILVQQSESPLYHMSIISEMKAAMQQAGFNQFETLLFPQPIYPSGLWSCTMAGKGDVDLTRFDVDTAQNKAFETHWYNAEIHQAALAKPEFMK